MGLMSVLIFLPQGNGVKGAFVKDEIPAIGSYVIPRNTLCQEIVDSELDRGFVFCIFFRGDRLGKRDRLLAVINTIHFLRIVSGFVDCEQQRAITAPDL